jgi:hypothetical protein
MALDYVELYSFSLLLQAGMVYTKWACKQHNNYWCSENGLAVDEVPLCDFKCWSLVCGECSQNQGAMLIEETSYFYSVW